MVEEGTLMLRRRILVVDDDPDLLGILRQPTVQLYPSENRHSIVKELPL